MATLEWTPMKASETRILTTHAGSLPRPARLAALHARRFAGEAVDPHDFEAEVAAAVTRAIAGQVKAGVDVGNNGEAPRESYVTYVRERLSGLGGRSAHPMMADMARYKGFLALQAPATPAASKVDMAAAPMATGPVAYIGAKAIISECAQLADAPEQAGQPFVEAFVSSPSPGLVTLAMQNPHYEPLADYFCA